MTALTFIHDDLEICLDINYFPYQRATAHSPEESAQFEIEQANTPEGEILDDDAIDHLMDNHYDEIMEQLEEELTAREEYMKDRSYDERV